MASINTLDRDNVFVNIIKEGATVFSRPEKVKTKNDSIIFEAYLQEADVINQNKRRYRREVLNEGMMRINKKIQRGALLGELDHPFDKDQVRQATVSYKEVSHIIREWGWDGNMIRGTLETLPESPNGQILNGLIRRKVPVGFSLRALADVEDNGVCQDVLSPMMIITYDCVSEPSHSTATIQEVKSESVVQIVKESNALISCSNGKCYLPNYFDELVERGILRLTKKYI